jgi:hypothetical protein
MESGWGFILFIASFAPCFLGTIIVIRLVLGPLLYFPHILGLGI